MKKFIFLLAVFLVSIGLKAHQADVSTTLLVEKEDGSWVLQISSSLTAYQHEIRTHFAATPYKTPEEFQEMVLKHIKNNFKVTFNGDKAIILSNGVVQLGHETKVVFPVLGIPSEIKSVVVKNTIFEDINRNQSALLLFKQGFAKEHFTLNAANEHTLALEVSGNAFREIGKNEASILSKISVYIVIVLGFSVLFIIFIKKILSQ